MCGIVGIYGESQPATLDKMLSCITHRGPDGQGTFVVPTMDLAMGARRLSIVDIESGSQPISNEDGSVTVVFNGEIYNHETLRDELQSLGHRFETRCDTEVLVHLWEEYGTEMPEHLEGMFAFSLWDEQEETLFLARDRLGIKPLFYTTDGDSLRWGSELTSLLVGELNPTVDRQAVYNFFSLKYTPTPQTMVSGIRKLPPGTSLTVSTDTGERRHRRYWDLEAGTVSGSRHALTSQIRSKLEAAVTDRLMGDVPVGAFLSGGLDSSAVVGLMAEHTDDTIKTYSVSFTGQEFDESSEARYVADHFGTEHTELTVNLDSFSSFDQLVTQFGEPLADPAALPTMLLAQHAGRDVKTVMTGEGADELFAGYGYYRRWPSRRQLAGSVPDSLYRASRAVASVLPARYQMYHAALASDTALILHLARQFEPEPTTYIDLDESVETSGLGDAINEIRTYADSYPRRLMTFDLKYWLPDDLLYKVDHTTMGASLEARVPFLSTDLVEFMYDVDHSAKVSNGAYKPLLNEAVADVVPERVRKREKHGFNIPVDRWFREPSDTVDRWFAESKIEATPHITCGDIYETMNTHRKGVNRGNRLWKMLVYVAWYHRVIVPHQRG